MFPQNNDMGKKEAFKKRLEVLNNLRKEMVRLLTVNSEIYTYIFY